MGRTYNQFAGQSLDRLAALSDGVFAIAMTLLVLDLHVPILKVTSEQTVLGALEKIWPALLVYFMTFMTLGIFWIGQQTQLNLMKESDRDFTWLHIGFLLWITLTPFSTAFLDRYETTRIALILYWLNLFLLGVFLYAGWAYAKRAGLVRDDAPPGIDTAIKRRIIVAQCLYAVGAALCVINTYVSIGAIVLVQINYALAPRMRWLYKL